MNDRLLKGTLVRITKHRPGWRGRIHSCCYGMYQVELTHDPDGQKLAYKHIDGLYARRELTPDPQPARKRSTVAIRRDKDVPLSER